MVNELDFDNVLSPNHKMAMVCAVISIVGVSPNTETIAQGMDEDDQFVIDAFENACRSRRKSLYLKGTA